MCLFDLNGSHLSSMHLRSEINNNEITSLSPEVELERCLWSLAFMIILDSKTEIYRTIKQLKKH